MAGAQQAETNRATPPHHETPVDIQITQEQLGIDWDSQSLVVAPDHQLLHSGAVTLEGGTITLTPQTTTTASEGTTPQEVQSLAYKKTGIVGIGVGSDGNLHMELLPLVLFNKIRDQRQSSAKIKSFSLPGELFRFRNSDGQASLVVWISDKQPVRPQLYRTPEGATWGLQSVKTEDIKPKPNTNEVVPADAAALLASLDEGVMGARSLRAALDEGIPAPPQQDVGNDNPLGANGALVQIEPPLEDTAVALPMTPDTDPLRENATAEQPIRLEELLNTSFPSAEITIRPIPDGSTEIHIVDFEEEVTRIFGTIAFPESEPFIIHHGGRQIVLWPAALEHPTIHGDMIILSPAPPGAKANTCFEHIAQISILPGELTEILITTRKPDEVGRHFESIESSLHSQSDT